MAKLPAIDSEMLVQEHVQAFEPPNSHDFTLKICIIGDQSVGKTALVNRYVKNKFSSAYQPTLGMDFSSRNVVLQKGLKGTLYKSLFFSTLNLNWTLTLFVRQTAVITHLFMCNIFIIVL